METAQLVRPVADVAGGQANEGSLAGRASFVCVVVPYVSWPFGRQMAIGCPGPAPLRAAVVSSVRFPRFSDRGNLVARLKFPLSGRRVVGLLA